MILPGNSDLQPESMSSLPDNTDPESLPDAETLICMDCGRVNRLIPGPNRVGGFRCTGCGNPLQSRRTKPVPIPCPACDEILDISPNWAGEDVRCPSCSSLFSVETSILSTDPTGNPRWMPAAIRKRTRGRRPKRKKRKVSILKRIPWHVVGAFVASVAIIGGIILEVGRREGKWMRPKAAAAEEPPAGEKQEPAEEARVDQIYSEEWRELTATVNRFLRAGHQDSLAGLIRFEREVLPRAASFYQRRLIEPVEVRSVEMETMEMIDGRYFFKLALKQAPFTDDEWIDAPENPEEPTGETEEATAEPPAEAPATTPPRATAENTRHIIAERLGEGRFLLDWDSYVRYRDEEWDTFTLREESIPRRFQVFVRRYDGDHPDFPFTDHHCFLAFWNHPSDGILFFVRRASEEEATLLDITTPAKLQLPGMDTADPPMGAAPATLSLSIEKDSNGGLKPRTATLVHLIHPGWVDRRPGDTNRE